MRRTTWRKPADHKHLYIGISRAHHHCSFAHLLLNRNLFPLSAITVLKELKESLHMCQVSCSCCFQVSSFCTHSGFRILWWWCKMEFIKNHCILAKFPPSIHQQLMNRKCQVGSRKIFWQIFTFLSLEEWSDKLSYD